MTRPEPGQSRIPRVRLQRVLQEMGFIADINTPQSMVLRNTDFPFQRITLPSLDTISRELVKLYAIDLDIDPDQLLQRCAK